MRDVARIQGKNNLRSFPVACTAASVIPLLAFIFQPLAFALLLCPHTDFT
jgi:hypothetical protein